jgi:hypothetical protein
MDRARGVQVGDLVEDENGNEGVVDWVDGDGESADVTWSTWGDRDDMKTNEMCENLTVTRENAYL